MANLASIIENSASTEEENGSPYLTGKQRAFVDHWFDCNFNGGEAARRAGYGGDDVTLRNIASQNLRKPKIQAAINERWASHGASPDEVAARLVGWMRGDLSQVMDEHGRINWQKVQQNRGIVKKLEWVPGSRLKVELYDAMRAAELIAKTMGMFRDQVNHSGEVQLKIVVDI